MNSVKRMVLEKLSEGVLTKDEAMEALTALSGPRDARPAQIAVIGMSCRFAMTPDVAHYWDNLINTRNCFVTKPPEKVVEDRVFANPHYAEFYDRDPHTPHHEDLERFVGPYLEDADKFDAAFFGISDTEADTMDPQHRVFLEQASRALEDAGYSAQQIRGTRTGCFVGRDGTNSNFYRHMVGPESAYHGGIWEGILASRINFHFDLRGPSSVVDTACSSSLVAMQMAMNHLRNGEIDTAIAGGVSLTCQGTDVESLDVGDLYSREIGAGSAVAGDGRLRSFDAKAAGSVFGEGASVVILKTLEAAERDGDHIYGIVSTVATNSDGASNGLTAPNPRAQSDLIAEAWDQAGVDGADVEYVETHGTGTPLGDPIEVLGLTGAFSRVTRKKQFCGIGSAKSNIGHTVGAAGTAGVIKVLLAMRHDVIPASANFEEPNPHIDFADSPVYVVDRPMPWPRRDTPRYAGVSSFGFSGTNAHVVLRDYTPSATVAADPGLRVFTVSARSERAFHDYLDNWSEYFAGDPGDLLEDICFTTTCGRGHFEYRLAIVASSLAELRTKFEECRAADWAENPARGVFVGSHRIVSDRKEDLERGELREHELGGLNRAGEKLVAELLSAEGLAAAHPAKELARNYVLGAVVPFADLYPDGGHRIPLPTYPFEKIPHWGVPRTSKIQPERVEVGTSTGQQLVTRALVDTPQLAVYQAVLTADQWVVRDHVIMSRRFIAGTVLVELMLESLRHRFGTDRIVLDDVLFLTPATSDDDVPLVVQIIVQDDGGTTTVEVLSRDDVEDAEWLTNARGTGRVDQAETPGRMRPIDEVIDDTDLVQLEVPQLVEFGPTWQNLRSIHRSASDPAVAYGVVELPDEYREQLDEHLLHPALMDNAVSMVPFLVHMKPSIYLPMAYSELTVYRPLPRRFYCRSERIPARGSELMSFTTQIVAEDGEVVATVKQFSMKRVTELDGFVSGAHYRIDWSPLPALEPAPADSADAGAVLVIGGDDETVARLRERMADAPVYRIEFSGERADAGDGHVRTEPSEEGVAWALEALGPIQPARVVDLTAATPDRNTTTEDELTHLVGEGVHAFTALVRGLLERCAGTVEFVVVADHAHEITGEEPFIDAGSATRLAMLKGLRHECPNFVITGIDIDSATPLDTIVTEALASEPGRVIVALREGRRLAPVLVEQRVEDGAERPVDLRADGYYLITGGLGSLGSVIAVALASATNEHVVIALAGRTPLPPREEWAALRAADPQGKIARVIENIGDMEARGASAEIVTLDVSDGEQVRVELDRLRAQHGPLRGVVHAAGVPGDGFLYTKSRQDIDRTLTPKIDGLRALSAHADLDELDFLVSFSSMTALIGGPGQVDYAAANAFLDAYTLGLRRRGVNAKSINWPGWSEVGMAADSGLANAATFFDSLTTSSAVAAFNELLVRDLTGVVPGKLNAEIFAQVGEDFVPFGFSDSLGRAIRRSRTKAEQAGGTGQEIARIAAENVQLTGKPAEQFTERERAVAMAYATVLGLDEINVHDSFTALGGNSITATELMRALNSIFGDVLNISDMFSYATPAEMAVRVAELTGEGTPQVEAQAGTAQTYDEMLAKLESGDIDADSMREYLGR